MALGRPSLLLRKSPGVLPSTLMKPRTGGAVNTAPTAGFSYVDAGTNGGITFTDTSTDTEGAIASWLWDFGDSTTSTAQNPSKTYSASGNYTVTLTVTDAGGLTDDYTAVVTVPTFDISISVLRSEVNNTDETSKTVGATLSPAGNSCILVWVASGTASGSPNIPTITWSGLTFAQVPSATRVGSSRRGTWMYAFTGASAPTPAAPVLDFAAQTQTLYGSIWHQVTGCNLTNIATLIPQIADPTPAASPLTSTLGSAMGTNSVNLVGSLVNNATAMTKDADFTAGGTANSGTGGNWAVLSQYALTELACTTTAAGGTISQISLELKAG